MKKLLFIDACVNRGISRTEQLAQALLKEMNQNGEYEIETLNLEDEDLKLFTGKESALRESLTRAGNFEGPLFTYAKQFAAADRIVVAAPYWDFSFPARMKCYLEQICVTGLTFTFSSKGIPGGLCHADSLHYVTTSGGSIGELNLGYEYLEKLCKVYYGINETVCYTAEGLDIEGNSVEEIMKEAEEKAVQKYRKFTSGSKL
ncbi:ACP phosphodiesterase [Clostridium sp. AF37-5AT]|jgi:FMN-dependent NADH-azoreductase|nr:MULTISPECIES: NAD(P)H-dependent oxidoreductase [unclassified Clostridium]RHN99679.1 ACP phosphodiesterase [Clostridium sp. AM22-16AC]RHO93925.1 ACP phosphodiesterase [Clostridium sp. AF37-5AT]RHS68549.1 ACP phosphodiesterase [Clostridium sp. AM45-5]RHT38866.1 ACP phosphodiesterase [Clostridium sp. AM30-24]